MALCVYIRGTANALSCRAGGSNHLVRVWRTFTSSSQSCYYNGVNIPRPCSYSANGQNRSTNVFRTRRRFYYGEPGRQRPPDTNVVKDVLLYENKDFNLHRAMGMFAVGQFTFWVYMAHLSYTEMEFMRKAEVSVYGEKGAPEDKKTKFSLAGLNFQLGSPLYWHYGMTTFCLGMGSIIVFAVTRYSRRNVYRLILRRGGQKCTVIPFGFFGRASQRFTVPLTKMSCLRTRDTIKSTLPIKIKGRNIFYLKHKRGKFYNSRLFDFTAGMKRMID